MAEKKQGRLFDLPETKGNFQLQGVVIGTSKDNFYKEATTKTQKPMRTINFGVKFDKGSTAYLNLQGFTKDQVVFSKSGKKGEKPIIEKVDWASRFTFNKEGFRPIGVNVGVKKIVDGKGNTVNDKKVLAEFDACKEIGDNLKDDQSVFIRGKLEFSHYKTDNGENRRNVKLVPSQVSLCKDINFDKEDFAPQNEFTQAIIFMGIDQEKDGEKPTGRFIVSAKIVTYTTIEDAEFVIENKDLANVFKKNLRPYNAVKIGGKIAVNSKTEDVSTTDYWGEKTNMEKIDEPTVREFIIVGADPASVDKELYTESNIQEALQKINAASKATANFGDEVPWGETLPDSTPEDDETGW